MPQRPRERSAQIGERHLHLGGAAALAVAIEQLLARERERDPEQALHDALVDLAREVDPLLQLAALLVVRGDLAGDRCHRDRLTERPQQMSLVVVHLRQARFALGHHNTDVATRGGHRRADDAHAREQLAHVRRHLEVLGAEDLQHTVLDERPPRGRHRVDRHEQVRELLQLDAVSPHRAYASPRAVVAHEHRALHRREAADRLAQAAEERVRRRALADTREQVGHHLEHLDVTGTREIRAERCHAGHRRIFATS